MHTSNILIIPPKAWLCGKVLDVFCLSLLFHNALFSEN